MRKNEVIILLASMTLQSCDFFSNSSGVPINGNIWVNGYLVSWEHKPGTKFVNSGNIRITDIDWNTLTSLTYFSLAIDVDGTPQFSIDPWFRNNINSDRVDAIVPAAYANNTKIIFSVGGGGNYEGFSTVIVDINRVQFIDPLLKVVKDNFKKRKL